LVSCWVHCERTISTLSLPLRRLCRSPSFAEGEDAHEIRLCACAFVAESNMRDAKLRLSSTTTTERCPSLLRLLRLRRRDAKAVGSKAAVAEGGAPKVHALSLYRVFVFAKGYAPNLFSSLRAESLGASLRRRRSASVRLRFSRDAKRDSVTFLSHF
jgi:hypothetical protein